MSWGALMVYWVLWMLTPVCLGEVFAFLLSGPTTTRQVVHERAAAEYQYLVRVIPLVWWVEAATRHLGPFGTAFRLSVWPLWFPNLWLIVDGSKQRPWRPWR